MKFEKFVKSLASTGTIYERTNGDRWLASPTVFMLIPPNTKSITGVGIYPMPENIEKMIYQVGHADDAVLVKAIMPFPDGGIKDCLRVFQSKSDSNLRCVIANDDWSLIEKSDMTQIKFSYDLDENKNVAKAMLVRVYPQIPDDEDELVGIIFPDTTDFGGYENG